MTHTPSTCYQVILGWVQAFCDGDVVKEMCLVRVKLDDKSLVTVNGCIMAYLEWNVTKHRQHFATSIMTGYFSFFSKIISWRQILKSGFQLSNIDAILDKAKRAQGGSSNALKKLNLDILEDPKLLARSTKNTTATLIQTQFEKVTRVRYAAHQFNLNTLEECAEYLQSLPVFIASYKYNQRLRFTPEKENVLRCVGT